MRNYCTRTYSFLTLHLESHAKPTNRQAFRFFSTSVPSPLLLHSENRSVFTRRTIQRHEFAKLLQLPPLDNPIAYYKTIHGQILVSNFQSSTFLANILISMYSKSGCLKYAREVFDKMPERNLISWSSVISMYTQRGSSEEALTIFSVFRRSVNENPNEFILASVICAVTQLGDLEKGTQLHGFVIKIGFDQDVYVGTSLIDFYSKIGEVEEARTVFDELSMKSAVTYTTIITGYAKSGRSEISLQLFQQMKESDIVPDRYVLSSVLTACSMSEFLEGGKQVHAYALRKGGEMDVSVSNVLIDFYVKCGRVEMGQKVFDQMIFKNTISWTTMISGYMQNFFDLEAVDLFANMSRLGLKPDGFACTSVLTSCGSIESIEWGRQVHAYAIKTNLDSDDFVNNGLVDMYSKCNSLIDSRQVFDVLSNRGVISYNTMIEGYSRQDKLHEALDLFREMRLDSIRPSLLTLLSLLGVSMSELNKQIHTLIIKFGLSFEFFAGSALVDAYAKCALLEEARLLFDEMGEKDIVVWNAMLFGYTQQSKNEEALTLFLEFQVSGHQANEFTFVALIASASDLASLPHGEQFHAQIVKNGLNFDHFVVNALVDMYAKCGTIEEAQKMFNSTSCRDIACWNSIMSTYSQHGEAEEALKTFDLMIKNGIQPNYITFVAVLSACAHNGLVEDGLHYFNSMRKIGIEPGTEHYACIVSLMGRAGKLVEAKEFIEKMPIRAEAIVWRSLLSACRDAGSVELGRYAAEKAISVDPEDSGSYILLSNIYASKGMWSDVKEIRKVMDFNNVVKETGCSWIELNKEVHVFVARNRSHAEAESIYSNMDVLIQHIRGVVYVPDFTTTAYIDD